MSVAYGCITEVNEDGHYCHVVCPNGRVVKYVQLASFGAGSTRGTGFSAIPHEGTMVPVHFAGGETPYINSCIQTRSGNKETEQDDEKLDKQDSLHTFHQLATWPRTLLGKVWRMGRDFLRRGDFALKTDSGSKLIMFDSGDILLGSTDGFRGEFIKETMLARMLGKNFHVQAPVGQMRAGDKHIMGMSNTTEPTKDDTTGFLLSLNKKSSVPKIRHDIEIGGFKDKFMKFSTYNEDSNGKTPVHAVTVSENGDTSVEVNKGEAKYRLDITKDGEMTITTKKQMKFESKERIILKAPDIQIQRG